jgi:hypothetical protein
MVEFRQMLAVLRNAALSSIPTPDDVARDYAEVEHAINQHTRSSGSTYHAALERLRDGAEVAQALAAECDTLRLQVATLERRISAEIGGKGAAIGRELEAKARAEAAERKAAELERES